MSSRQSEYYRKYRKYKSKYFHLLQSGGADPKPCPGPGYPAWHEGPCPDGAMISEDKEYCPACENRMYAEFDMFPNDPPPAPVPTPAPATKVRKPIATVRDELTGDTIAADWQEEQKLEREIRHAERDAERKQRQSEDLKRSRSFGRCPECGEYGISTAKRYKRPTCTLCGFQPKWCQDKVVIGGYHGTSKLISKKAPLRYAPCPRYAEIGDKCYPHSRANELLRKDGLGTPGAITINDPWLKPEHQP